MKKVKITFSVVGILLIAMSLAAMANLANAATTAPSAQCTPTPTIERPPERSNASGLPPGEYKVFISIFLKSATCWLFTPTDPPVVDPTRTPVCITPGPAEDHCATSTPADPSTDTPVPPVTPSPVFTVIWPPLTITPGTGTPNGQPSP